MLWRRLRICSLTLWLSITLCRDWRRTTFLMCVVGGGGDDDDDDDDDDLVAVIVFVVFVLNVQTGMTLIVNVKSQVMARLARLTGSIVVEALEGLNFDPKLGVCVCVSVCGNRF